MVSFWCSGGLVSVFWVLVHATLGVDHLIFDGGVGGFLGC